MTGRQPHRDYPPRARLRVILALVLDDVLRIAGLVWLVYCAAQGFAWLFVRYAT